MTHFLSTIPSSETKKGEGGREEKKVWIGKKEEKKKTDGVYVKKLPTLFHQGLSSIFQHDFDTNALTTADTR